MNRKPGIYEHQRFIVEVRHARKDEEILDVDHFEMTGDTLRAANDHSFSTAVVVGRAPAPEPTHYPSGLRAHLVLHHEYMPDSQDTVEDMERIHADIHRGARS